MHAHVHMGDRFCSSPFPLPSNFPLPFFPGNPSRSDPSIHLTLHPSLFPPVLLYPSLSPAFYLFPFLSLNRSFYVLHDPTHKIKLGDQTARRPCAVQTAFKVLRSVRQRDAPASFLSRTHQIPSRCREFCLCRYIQTCAARLLAHQTDVQR